LLLPGSEIFSAAFRFVGDPDSNSKELLLGWVWGALKSPNGHFASDSKQPSVDCEVEVSDLGVVRSIISGFAWNWKKSVSKVKLKKSSELKGSGLQWKSRSSKLGNRQNRTEIGTENYRLERPHRASEA
jgi:hypothetical protein